MSIFKAYDIREVYPTEGAHQIQNPECSIGELSAITTALNKNPNASCPTSNSRIRSSDTTEPVYWKWRLRIDEQSDR